MASTADNKPKRQAGEALWATRREEILEQAALLFARYGYSDTDTQQVCDAVGVGKGTVYRYFPSKRELFLAATDRVMRRMIDRVLTAIAGIDDPLERVAAGIRTFLTFFAEHPEFVELLIQERAQFKDRTKPTFIEHREVNIERWRQLYRGLISAERVRSMPVDRITDVVGNLLYGTIFTNYFAGPQKTAVEQAEDIIDVFFNGILTAEESRRRGTG